MSSKILVYEVVRGLWPGAWFVGRPWIGVESLARPRSDLERCRQSNRPQALLTARETDQKSIAFGAVPVFRKCTLEISDNFVRANQRRITAVSSVNTGLFLEIQRLPRLMLTQQKVQLIALLIALSRGSQPAVVTLIAGGELLLSTNYALNKLQRK